MHELILLQEDEQLQSLRNVVLTSLMATGWERAWEKFSTDHDNREARRARVG